MIDRSFLKIKHLGECQIQSPLDESTVRKKLKEYEALGILRSEKQGREVL